MTNMTAGLDIRTHSRLRQTRQLGRMVIHTGQGTLSLILLNVTHHRRSRKVNVTKASHARRLGPVSVKRRSVRRHRVRLLLRSYLNDVNPTVNSLCIGTFFYGMSAGRIDSNLFIVGCRGTLIRTYSSHTPLYPEKHVPRAADINSWINLGRPYTHSNTSINRTHAQ